jgi:hypothetical protein
MTVPRRLAANRRNARRSTGPRTASGKRSVAVNALRHGLSVPVFADPSRAPEVAELAERIAKGSTDAQVRERARERNMIYTTHNWTWQNKPILSLAGFSGLTDVAGVNHSQKCSLDE